MYENYLWEVSIVNLYSKCALKDTASDYWPVSHYSLAMLNQGGTHYPTPPPNSWRMNQGNVAPGFSEQAVTWNTARSDFLLVVTPPIPQPAGLPFKRWGSIQLNPDWFSKEAAWKENVLKKSLVLPVKFFNFMKNNNLSCLHMLWCVVVIPGPEVWQTGAFEWLKLDQMRGRFVYNLCVVQFKYPLA